MKEAMRATGLKMGFAHVTNEGLYCSRCCPIHEQPAIDWEHPAETVAGAQAAMFPVEP